MNTDITIIDILTLISLMNLLILVKITLTLLRQRRIRKRRSKTGNLSKERSKELFNNISYCNGKIPHPKTKIGKFTCIAEGAWIGASQHPMDWLSVHAFQYVKDCKAEGYGNIINHDNVQKVKNPSKPCDIGNDVWIGGNAIIKPGIKIGDGAIVGAGAVITKDVEPYAVVVGVPAKVIKYRFDQDIIDQLLTLKWWDLPKEFILTLPFSDIKECIKMIKKYRFKK